MKEGIRLGNNIIAKRLGVGRTAEVFAAFNTEIGKEVALKVFRSDYPSAKLDHEASVHFDLHESVPHVVPLLDAGSHRINDDPSLPPLPYFVLDQAKGGNVLQAVNRFGPFGIEEGIKVVSKAAVPLDALQNQDTPHGDVKTESILLADDPSEESLPADQTVWMSDFGMTGPTNLDGERRKTSIGTVTYASPEQVSGRTAPTTDQFGAAASLVEVSFGRKVIPIPELPKYKKQVLSRAFGGYLDYRTNLIIPAPYQQPIRQAMDPDHEKRFESVRAFLQELADRHEEVLASTASSGTIIDLAVGDKRH